MLKYHFDTKISINLRNAKLLFQYNKEDTIFQKYNLFSISYYNREMFFYKHLDTLHNTHYEVYDSTGKNHLGEASIDGIFDVIQKDPDKHLSI